MATASPAADGGRGRPWEGGLVSWPPAPPLTLPWTWMGPSWGQHPGVGDAESPLPFAPAWALHVGCWSWRAQFVQPGVLAYVLTLDA
jgi:hypothetical protein